MYLLSSRAFFETEEDHGSSKHTEENDFKTNEHQETPLP